MVFVDEEGCGVIKAGLDFLVGVIYLVSEYWVLGVEKWSFTRSVRSNTDYGRVSSSKEAIIAESQAEC